MKNINISIKLPKNISFSERCDVFKLISMFVYYKPNDMSVKVESIDINSLLDISISYNEFLYDYVSQKKITHIKYLKEHLFLRKKLIIINKDIEIYINGDVLKDPEYIRNKVEEYFKIPSGSLNIKTNKREIVEKRQIAHYISRKQKYSFSIIGKTIGNVDHATVLHSCKVISNLIETDRKFRDEFYIINKTI